MTTCSKSYEIIPTTTEEEWLDARRGFVTASEVGKLARLDQREWDQLREEKATGVQAFKGNAYTRWGHKREPHILKWVQENVDPTIRANDQLYVSRVWTKFAATPDGISIDGKVTCQVKTSGHGLDPKDPYPHYMDQVQWELLVTGAERCILVVEHHDEFVVTGPPVYAVIPRDEDRIHELMDIAARFLAGDPAVEVGDDQLRTRLDEWAAAEEEARAAHHRAMDAKARFEELVKDTEGEKFASYLYQVTRTPATTRTMLDQRQLKEQYPEVFAACQVEKPMGAVLRAPRRLKQK